MNKHLLTVLCLILTTSVWAQSNTSIQSEYDRISLTVLGDLGSRAVVKVDNQYNSNLKSLSIKGVTDLDQVDYNYVTNPKLELKYPYRNFKKKHQLTNGKRAVDFELKENNIGKGIVSYMFNRDKDGFMNSELIEQRGLYNATVGDELNAQATYLGEDAALRDQGYGLLSNNYIVVLDMLTRNGQNTYVWGALDLEDLDFRAESTMVAYIYKLKLDDSVLEDVIFRQAWVLPSDTKAERNAKNKIFNNIKYEYEFVDVVATQGWNTKESEYDVLIRKITNAIGEWGVTTPVLSTKPIEARIGKKESLKNNDRFFVYEFKEDKSGAVNEKRVAVIRAANVCDNTTDNSKTSQFVRVAGRKVEEGYTLKKRDDAGFIMDLGYRTGVLDGYSMSWSWLLKTNKNNIYTYPVTTITYKAYNIDEMGVDDYQSDFASIIISYDRDVSSYFQGAVFGDKIKSLALGLGYGVGCRIGGNFEIEGRAQYNIHWLTGADFYGLTSTDNPGNTTNFDGGFQFGAKCNVNLYYPLKLFVSADYCFMDYPAADEITSDTSVYQRRITILNKCGKTFEGLTYSFGLSYTF